MLAIVGNGVARENKTNLKNSCSHEAQQNISSFLCSHMSNFPPGSVLEMKVSQWQKHLSLRYLVMSAPAKMPFQSY